LALYNVGSPGGSAGCRRNPARSHAPNAFNFHQGREPMAARTRIPLSQFEEHSRTAKERLEMSTAEIGLTVRTTNCLEERGIFTVRDLLNCTREDLLSISNFGEKTLEEVYLALEKFGFYRKGRTQPK
jgi:DNA-directed RNA polymerase subunit alpha